MINTKTERDKMQTHTRDKIQTEREKGSERERRTHDGSNAGKNMRCRQRCMT